MSQFLLVGKECRSYKDKMTGEPKQYRALHGVWKDRQKEGLIGQQVEEVRIPYDLVLDMKVLEVGKAYTLAYEKQGNYPRLYSVDLVKA